MDTRLRRHDGAGAGTRFRGLGCWTAGLLHSVRDDDGIIAVERHGARETKVFGNKHTWLSNVVDKITECDLKPLLSSGVLTRKRKRRVDLLVCSSLVSILLGREKEKGSPLMEQEVEEIRDSATVIAIPAEQIPALEEGRGYKDINPENCWTEWQQVRGSFE